MVISSPAVLKNTEWVNNSFDRRLRSPRESILGYIVNSSPSQVPGAPVRRRRRNVVG